MTEPAYCELRASSAFSFLRSASLPEDLVERAARLEYTAIALGDRDGVYGAPRFHQAAKKAGVRAIVGCEITLRVDEAVRLLGCSVVRPDSASALDHRATAQQRASALNDLTTNNPTTCSLYLLVSTRTGYQNLCKLITQTKLRSPKGESSVTWDDLDGHTDGLICLAGGMEGPMGQVVGLLGCYVVGPDHLTTNTPTTNNLEQPLDRLRSLFPNRLYIDLQRHFDPGEERFNRACIDLARHWRIPLLATNGVRHATADGRRLFDVLTCIRTKTSLDAAGRLLARNAERHLKPPAEMAALFRDLPEAVANTRRVAEQCEFSLADLGYRFPDYPLPAGETAMSHLRRLTYEGARHRYGRPSTKVRRQLEHELQVIGKLDLAGYFLIVWDIVRFCREQHILAQGRGSAANSAVCYALGITAVDAVGMELLFERFLSEERGEWPDIDIDLPSGEQRERVIQYVYQRYGDRGAAMTANVITYRTRSAVREVGKTLGFATEQVDKLSKLLNRFEFRDGNDELAKQLRDGGVDPQAPRVGLLVDLVQRLKNLPRHLGQHSGGMVIPAGRLDTVVPLEPASMPGRVVVQWDKDDCADLGIIKVDLLGLGMMAALEEAIPLIRCHEGVDIDLAHLPPDDPPTYAMLQRADTVGVFQVESRAQMATLPRMRPEHFYDLVVQVAIIRPGPIVGQMVHPYLNRRAGREAVTYAHPDLEPILKRTLGVPIFQEQLLRMAMTVAGFTGGEAEELRRAMGFKRSTERMEQIETRLRAGMARRGIVGEKQDEVVRSITSFALYGFPESHAASFALLAYASAYLRAHHLAAFTCALLNHWPLGFYHPATLVKDAQRHGLRVLPVDVTRSGWDCRLEEVVGLLGCYVVKDDSASAWGKQPLLESNPPSQPTTNNLTSNNPTTSLSLRLGLRYVSGLRKQAGRRIEAERLAAPFNSISEVIHRCDLRDDEVQALAHLGAFSNLGATRREALWQASKVQREPLLATLQDDCIRLHAPVHSDIIPRPLTPRDTGSKDEPASRSIIPGTLGLASVHGVGEGGVFSDAGAAGVGDIRPEQSDQTCRQLDPSQHCRGQRSVDTKGLHPFPADRAGKPAGTGNAPTAGRRGRPAQAGEHRSASGPGRIGSQATQSPDPVTGVRPPSNNLTTNNPTTCPLPEMSLLDRTLADYRNSGVTVGPHIVRHLRPQLDAAGVLRAVDLQGVRDGSWTKIAGLVIVRQRPGTAKGFCFITLEDETGTANAVVVPQMFQRYRSLIHTSAMLIIEGPVQKVGTEWQGNRDNEGQVVGLLGCYGGMNSASPPPNNLTTNNLTTPTVPFVIHVRAKRIQALELPQQDITLTGHGYRMRVTPEGNPPSAPNNQQPNNKQPDIEQPVPLPKSHDFR